MTRTFADQIMDRLHQAEGLYHRLVVIAVPAGGGKTEALRSVAERTGAPLVNVNLELSTRMLDLTERQRALAASRLLAEIVEETGAAVVLLDNTEVLFDPSLKLDAVRVLQSLSRNRTVVAAWNGTLQGGQLVYASPGHPEHVKAPARDFLCVSGGTGAGCSTAAGGETT